MASESDKIRALAVAFTSAVATAGRLADELDSTLNDLNAFIDRREVLFGEELTKPPASPDSEGGDVRD